MDIIHPKNCGGYLGILSSNPVISRPDEAKETGTGGNKQRKRANARSTN